MQFFDQTAFGKRLKEVRLLQGITREQLADAIHISQEYLRKIEQGRRCCSVYLVVAISCQLHVSTDYLLLGKESEPQDKLEKIRKIADELFITINTY